MAQTVRNLPLRGRLGRSPGEGNGNPLQGLAWRTPWTEEQAEAMVLRVAKSQPGLSIYTFTFSDRVRAGREEAEPEAGGPVITGVQATPPCLCQDR